MKKILHQKFLVISLAFFSSFVIGGSFDGGLADKHKSYLAEEYIQDSLDQHIELAKKLRFAFREASLTSLDLEAISEEKIKLYYGDLNELADRYDKIFIANIHLEKLTFSKCSLGKLSRQSRTLAIFLSELISDSGQSNEEKREFLFKKSDYLIDSFQSIGEVCIAEFEEH